MTKQFLLILLIFVQAALFGQAPISNTALLTYEQANYQIQYPQLWTIDTSHQMATEFILFSPQTDSTDRFKENVNLIIQDFGDNIVSLDEFVVGTVRSLPTYFKNSQIFLNERKEKEGQAYHQFVYQGKLHNRDLKFEQYIWVLQNKSYILTLTCEQNQFDNYLEVGEQILNSFQFLKK